MAKAEETEKTKTEEATWHVGAKGERKGPFTASAVAAMIAKGEATARDVVWKEGMADWKPLSEVEDFADALKTAPPPPPAPPAGPNPALEYLKAFWADLRGILVDPDKGTTAVAAKRQICFPLAWIVLGVLVAALLAMQGNSFNRGRAFGMGLLFELIDYATVYGLTILAVGAILRTKADWIDVFSIVGLAAVPTVILGLLAFITIWIHGFFGVLITVGLVLNILLFARVLQQVTQLTWRVALYAVPAIYLAQAIIHWLVVRAF